MTLPEHITRCIELLEAAGYAAYVVGGCVRDACLGLTAHDFDICSAARPEQTEAVFRDYPLLLEGKKHGTVSVVMGGDVVEITTFRMEGGYTDNRHPDWVEFVDTVEADLARRDFTVNAIAWSPTRGYADPFGGRKDLQEQILRAVGDPERRFREDSLRILRGIRFAARYALQIEPETERAMHTLAPLMENLARERVFEELSRLLPVMTAGDVLRFAPVLTSVIPELKPMVDFDQRSPHHAFDLYTHMAYVVAGTPAELTLRWAALLHDVGKVATFTQDETGRGHYYGHAEVGAQMADEILRRLRAPSALRYQVVTLVENHMTRLIPDRKMLRFQLAKLGWETVEQSLQLQQADMNSKGLRNNRGTEQICAVREMLDRIRDAGDCLSIRQLTVSGHDLLALGLTGKTVGQTLQQLLECVMEDRLENDRDVLLAWVKELKTKEQTL